MDWHFTHDVPYKKRKCFRDPNLSGDSFEDNQRQQTFAQDFQGHQEELFAVLCGVDDIGDDILKEYAENIAQEEVNVYPLTKTKRWLDCSQEAIQRLRVNGKLDIKGKEMKVWICTQSEMDVVVDRRRLVLNGLAGDTPKDMVILYVEAISGFLSDDFNIEYFSDAEMAVVTFQTPIDFRCLFEKRSRKKILNKREIKARLLEVTNCVLVEGVALNLIEDLHLYFENKIRSGGGELSNVIIKEDERNVYLYFKDLAGCPQTQSSATTVTSPSCITTNEGLNISLVIGSIEEENSDVIINTTSANMKLDSGKVSSAIFRKAGPTLQNLVDNIVQGQSIRSGQIVKTDVTGLNLCCHMVYHTSLGSWDNGKHLHKFMKHSLEMAHRDGVSSISFPALGTGMLSYPPAMVSSFMFSEVINFSQSHQKTMLKDIRFVIFSKDQLVISAFQAELAKHLRVLGSSYSGLNEAACSQAAMIGEFCLPTPQRPSVPRKVPPFKSAYQNEVVIVKVFGKLKNNVDDVSKMMKELVDKECSPKRIQSNYVSSLKDEDINVLEKVESDCDVKITLAFTHIQIEGMSSDVFSAATNVNKVMSELEKKHIEESLFTSFAKWLFDDNGQMKAFHKAEVIQIERAFLREEKQVVIKRPAGNLVINFNKNEATNPQGETIRVRRECIFQEPPDPHALKIDIPLNWARMPKGQEVMRVWLHPQSDEYKNVETRFLKTITAFKVFRIERIQNMSLYHTYQVMKKSIESRNDGQVICEKLLFHGTRSDSIDNINHHGFNRSYAGKNATVLGVGTYFALNAWYSASDTYSKPDANGTKYMFQARVLTGSYCKGDASMKEPPLKSPFSKTVRYDSVVDNCFSPSMFVVFYDNQAYPEYLITFSK
uniref:Poly [ADP-ribose] polymerase n=1 Tax=Petromyzon marinus TaxID=7757 RepID=A0AAJ7WL60_PETMA|nr:protein mono-ADP-ribosyltransferase PARP14-like isoform X4 [Petromyzon marinus]